jgi:hypothetical protein
LFERVVSVLEQARSNVVRAVNSEMIIAYWLIGREIVQEIQSGEKRAEKELEEELKRERRRVEEKNRKNEDTRKFCILHS